MDMNVADLERAEFKLWLETFCTIRRSIRRHSPCMISDSDVERFVLIYGLCGENRSRQVFG